MPSSLTTLLPFVLGFSPHLPVSVCGTGDWLLIAAFLASVESAASVLFSLPVKVSNHPAYFTTGLSPLLSPTFSAVGSAYPSVSPRLLTSFVSTGISTCYPSPTPFGLCLGPDLPWVDEPSPGILRFSTVKILTSLSLLIPAFSLLPRPHVLPVMLRPITLRSPTNAFLHSAASVYGLAPLIFGAGSLD